MDYLNMLDRIYVFDGFAGWDPEVRPVLLHSLVGLSLPRVDWMERDTCFGSAAHAPVALLICSRTGVRCRGAVNVLH